CLFYIDTSTTPIYTLSLHDALPILIGNLLDLGGVDRGAGRLHHIDGLAPLLGVLVGVHDSSEIVTSDAFFLNQRLRAARLERKPDRKSTRLNSSHVAISYAVFCLKK